MGLQAESKAEYDRVVVAGVYEPAASYCSEEEFEHSMEELRELAIACNMNPVGRTVQTLEHKNTAGYLGPGKITELKLMCDELRAELVILNDTLTPTQLRNLQNELKRPVMDRTALILEIFRSRARTREARLQVELARLQYLKPRLIGMWETQNRQGGASGSMSSKGEGEKQLELDRRTIDHRLAELRRELKHVEGERKTQRKKRQNSRLPLVGLVGYTNAGKSTIMNAFVDRFSDEEKRVFEADMLFATLDTTVRRISAGDNMDFLLSDTVGFIQQLPTGLVEAFKSTLEEVREADLLIQVVDRSDKNYKDHIATTRDTLRDLGAGHIPMIIAYNKADMCDAFVEYPRTAETGREGSEDQTCIYMSAKEDSSITMLRDLIIDKVYGDYVEAEFLIPYDKGNVTGYFLENSQIIDRSYEAEGTKLTVRCHRADREKYKEYEQ